jgi:hypothetical protein
MLKLGERDRELLAELHKTTAFSLLMRIFREFEQDVLNELAGEKITHNVIRISRFYQCMRSIREFLENVPADIAHELELLRQGYLYDDTGLSDTAAGPSPE